ncbi:hypothetical protein D9619_005682 [Psilocybe cf. subviscida]|uniref:Globin-sensor domain-containing protein n=1 Tax=Psilocybe cf. subviscida TaxID=2480587 RepID=A0A8H5FB84_9AGAR|nr:hypothetical protein D9619_005682 [Psilocybe cf. subviscida]
MPSHMQFVTESSLSDLPHRIQYLRNFVDFTSEDAAILHTTKPLIAPLIPTVVDTVYDKLLSFSVTAKAFVPRQTGYSGATPTKLADLSQDHPQIRFRKDFLANYLVKLVSMDYEKIESWQYLDKVGLMHTGQSGFSHRVNKPALRVEYVHCAALLGYVEDIVINAILTHPDIELETKTAALRAFNKILWIQNDLFARHYIPEASTKKPTSLVSSLFANRTALATAASVVVLGCAIRYITLASQS